MKLTRQDKQFLIEDARIISTSDTVRFFFSSSFSFLSDRCRLELILLLFLGNSYEEFLSRVSRFSSSHFCSFKPVSISSLKRLVRNDRIDTWRRRGRPFERLHRPTCKEAAELRESIWQLSPAGLVCTTGHQARTLRANERESHSCPPAYSPREFAIVFSYSHVFLLRKNYWKKFCWKLIAKKDFILGSGGTKYTRRTELDVNRLKSLAVKAQWHAWIPRTVVTSHWAGRSSAKNEILKVSGRDAGTINVDNGFRMPSSTSRSSSSASETALRLNSIDFARGSIRASDLIAIFYTGKSLNRKFASSRNDD